MADEHYEPQNPMKITGLRRWRELVPRLMHINMPRSQVASTIFNATTLPADQWIGPEPGEKAVRKGGEPKNS